MPGDPPTKDDERTNRGRIQAQGGGTEKSEAWAQAEPPTDTEMLDKCDRLEDKLTNKEREDRSRPLKALRRFIRDAAKAGGVSAPLSKSFLKTGSRDIRVDLEVIKGTACVPSSS
jgi:hypothetical protein